MLAKPVVAIRLLGPIAVTVAGTPRDVPGLRRKAVLAVLALHRGAVVTNERIIDLAWGGNPPASAASALQNAVSYLRGVLGDRSFIVAGVGGYALRLPDGSIDLDRAEHLIRGRDFAPREQADRLRAALDLWNGRSLSGVTEVPWLAEQAERLEQLRADATTALLDARLALGEHAELVPELRRAAGANPFREDLHRRLMLALYRSGHPAGALDTYRELRRAMRDELGIEPGPALRELEAAIRRRDTALAPPPAQLPHTPPTFTARGGEMSELDAALDAGLVTISGTAGVGKTTLAVRWANSVAAAFPDGQLYVNLRGFDPSGRVMPPGEALRGFLRALDIPARDVPATLDDRTALYRTLLTGRRFLVLLDNARDEEQVRPLLPGSGGLVVVTSRNRLTGLVVAEGARNIPLERPSTADARQILARRVGADRVAAEPEAVGDIVARCARLPLALAVAAARAAIDPGLSLAAVARQLAEGLDAFGGGDATTDVRAVFSWSYRALSAPAAQLFGRMGVFPAAPDFSLAGLASLAGLPPRETQPLLAELTRMHLLTEISPGRYGCHDLLRAFAAEQAPDAGDGARQRLLDHYLHTAYAAKSRYQPPRDPIELPPRQPGVHPADLTGSTAATAWFDRELPALLAAATLDPPTPAWRPWQLAWTLSVHLERQGRWREYEAVHRAGLAAAERSGDEAGRAYAHFFLGRATRRLNRPDECREHRARATALFRSLGDPIGEAGVLLDGAVAEYDAGHPAGTVAAGERALALYRSAGFRSGIGHALSDLAWMVLATDELDRSRDLAEQGLAIHRENDDARAQADTLDTLGHVHFRLGDEPRGTSYYRESASLYRQLGDRYNEADTLVSLGNDLAAAGRREAAERCRRQVAAMLGELSRTDAARIRRKLPA